MQRGFIKIWRKIRDSEVSGNPNCMALLVHLLINAEHTAKDKPMAGYRLEAGQCDSTQDQLVKQTGLTRQELRTALRKLNQGNLIQLNQVANQGSNRKRNIITIVNWGVYQGGEKELTNNSTKELTKEFSSEQPTTNQQLTKDQPVLKNDKNDKKKNTPTELADLIEHKEPKNKKKNKIVYSGPFESWWELYPRKTAKAAACKAFERLSIVDKRLAWKGAEAYSKAVAKWPKADKGFIPHPSTWLNDRRWEDDQETWEREAPKPKFGKARIDGDDNSDLMGG